MDTQVIPMMTELWDPAVEIAIDNGDHFKSITNTRDALAWLMTSWPKQGGKTFAAARRACIEAIEGRVDASAAAEAFKEAAAEVGILRQWR